MALVGKMVIVRFGHFSAKPLYWNLDKILSLESAKTAESAPVI